MDVSHVSAREEFQGIMFPTIKKLLERNKFIPNKSI